MARYNLAERLRQAIFEIANNIVVLDDKGEIDPAKQAQIDTYNNVIMLIGRCSEPLPLIDVSTLTIPELAELLVETKVELEHFGDIKTDMQKLYDYLSIEVIPDRMDDEGIDSVKVSGVGRLQTSSDIRCSVLAANKDKLKDWLNENGQGAIIQDSINSSTLKAFVKERMKENLPYPAELLQISPYSRATVVKA